jgi:photosystem II stability/assembly factor-like uncharacterized protein
MKKNCILFTYMVAAATLLSSAGSFAQTAIGKWVNTGPVNFPMNASGQVNGLGRVSQLKFHPSNKDIIYAVSASGGLYITKDNGKTWNFTVGTETLPQTSCSSVCIDYKNDSTIYLSTGDADYYSSGYGIYKTTNAGVTWSAVTTGIGTKMAVEILMDSSDNKVLVAATNSGIWKTTDAGANWTQTRVGGTFRDMQARPGSKRTLYAATETAFFVSNDFGSTWTQITSGLSFPSGNTGVRIGVTKADTNIVYLLTTKGNGVVFKSTDGGANFSTVYNSSTQCLVCYDASPSSGSQGNYNIDINVNPQNKNELLVIAHNVWRSTDGGVTWNKRTAWYDEVHTDMHHILWNPYDNKQMFMANDGGVWLTTDTTARNWSPRCDGVAACEIYQAAQSQISRDVVSIGTQDNGELYYNSDWRTNRGGDWTSKCAFDYIGAGTTVYYLGSGNRRSLVPMSGETSFSCPFTPTNNACIEFVPSVNKVSFLGKDTLYRSDNIDASSPSWTMLRAATDRIWEISSCRADSTILYFVTNNNKFVRCDNALSASPSFTVYTTPASTAATASITTNKNDANIVYLSCGSAIYKSSNKGATWTAITGTGLSGLNIRKILHDDYSTNERLFVYAGNYVHSKNNTTTVWTNYTQNLPSVCAGKNMMIYNPGNASSVLRISTYGRGVWECGINNDKKPMVDFRADKRSICVGDTVRYYKTTYGITSSVSWSFPGGSPATSTADSPVVVYTSKGNFDAKCIVSGTTGADTMTKVAYIEVGKRPVSGLAEGFEAKTFPPANWRLESQSYGQWEMTDDCSGFGTSTQCAIFDNNGIDAGGKHDRLVTPMVALKTVSKALLSFDVAYQPYSASYPDSLLVTISSDCGRTWKTVYSKSGNVLATSPASAIYYRFTPSPSKWRKDTVDLSAYAGADVLIAFENVGYFGQALFLDNVNLVMTPAVDFAASDTEICVGGTVVFSDSSLNAASLAWTFTGGTPGGSIAKVVSVTYPVAGTYPVTLVGTNALGSSTLIKKSYIKVNPKPTISIIVSGPSLVAVGPAAVSWQWYKNGILIPGATGSSYTPTSSGDYTVTITDAKGCTNTSDKLNFVPNGINNIVRNQGFEIYPNPSNGRVFLKATDVGSGKVTVSFFNALGQQIASEQLQLNGGTFIKEFDWSQFPKGIYEVRIQTEDKKVVITKMVLQ